METEDQNKKLDSEGAINFEVVRKMEFNSDRKRMSVLLKDPNDAKYKLYVKGADSIIMERIDKSTFDEGQL
jgi:phospholipid-translocating ATPase